MGILDLALAFLAGKDRSTYEIKQYLLKKGADGDEVDQVLIHLAEMQYLDDGGYCLRYLQRAIGKGKGIAGIQYELKGKGISADLVEEALLKLDIEDRRTFEKKRAYGLAKKLMGNALDLEGRTVDVSDSRKLRSKMARRLAARGFDEEVVYDVVYKMLGDEQWEQ